MIPSEKFNTPIQPNWCPGCGNYSIWNSLKQALGQLNIAPHEAVLTFDIGCSGNMADKINTYGFKTLHGRTIAAAMGITLANPEINVIATGGDGGMFEEGINHLIWASRSNYNMTAIMHNNRRFALTTGQPTITTPKDEPNKTAPWGVVESSINPLRIALVSNATFIARGFAGDAEQLTKLIKAAIKHKGFAFLEILQPCPTLNKVNTFKWFKDRIYKLEDRKHDPSNWNTAFKVAEILDKKIATGIIYQDKKSVPFSQRLPYRKGVKTTPVQEVKKYPVKNYVKEFI